MAYILDGAAILVVLLAVFIGYHRGFVRSLIQLVGLIAAAVVAAALSTGIAALVFDNFISDGLTQTVSSKIQTADTATAAESLQQALEELPGPISNAPVSYTHLYKEENDTTVLLVSHSMEDVARTAKKVLVMNGGRIAMYAPTAEVFSRAEELEAIGLSIPAVTKVFMRLREKGYPVGDNVYTVGQAEQRLLPLLKGGSAPC